MQVYNSDKGDQYVDMVHHTNSTDEYPLLTPYKPHRYPEHAERVIYPFLLDTAAQVCVVRAELSTLLAHATTKEGAVIGVGGIRARSMGFGILSVIV